MAIGRTAAPQTSAPPPLSPSPRHHLRQLLRSVAREHLAKAHACPPQRLTLDGVAGGRRALMMPLSLIFDRQAGALVGGDAAFQREAEG